MSAWFRMALPRPLVVNVIATCWVGWHLIIVGILMMMKGTVDEFAIRGSFGPMMLIGFGGPIAAAAAMGVCRFLRYPLPGSNYESLLATMPWSQKDRLPFGPWMPSLHDLPILLGIAILGVLPR